MRILTIGTLLLSLLAACEDQLVQYPLADANTASDSGTDSNMAAITVEAPGSTPIAGTITVTGGTVTIVAPQ
jgi:hypothetical protein